jgi:hypothetical protein
MGLHTRLQTIDSMHRIRTGNHFTVIMTCGNDYILFAGDLTGRSGILKPQTTGTGVVGSLTILGAGGIKACDLGCIVGMYLVGITAIIDFAVATAAADTFSAFLANNFTVAAGIAAGTKSGCTGFTYLSAFAAHLCTAFATATIGAPFKCTAST